MRNPITSLNPRPLQTVVACSCADRKPQSGVLLGAALAALVSLPLVAGTSWAQAFDSDQALEPEFLAGADQDGWHDLAWSELDLPPPPPQ